MRRNAASLPFSKYRTKYSLTFDGISDWMVNYNLFGVSTFPIRKFNKVTVSMWVKSEKDDASSEQTIINRWFPFDGLIIDEGGWRWYLWDASGGGNPLVSRAMVFQVSTHALQGLWVYSTASFPLDTWVHVTMTYDGSGTIAGFKMYWDGVLQTTYTIWGTWTTNALNSNAYSHLLWGVRYTAFPGGIGPVWPPVLDYWFEGKMDESCFWRYELNAQEVLGLYNGGFPINPMHVGLKNGKTVDRYFRMGEPSDGTPWVPPHSISWCRFPVGGTQSNGFWNNDGATPPLRVSTDIVT